MFRRLIMVSVLLFPLLGQNSANAGTATFWRTYIGPQGAWIGVERFSQDGYDGQSPADTSGSGIFLFHHRAGSGWPEPPRFYREDYESPIPLGGSHVWPDMYLWAQNFSVPGNTASIVFGDEATPPPGYLGHLELDYVPESVGWPGPMDFWLDLTQGNQYITLPVPEVSDGLQGTRMHLTVYATIPEPCSLLALGSGLGLLGVFLRRRR